MLELSFSRGRSAVRPAHRPDTFGRSISSLLVETRLGSMMNGRRSRRGWLGGPVRGRWLMRPSVGAQSVAGVRVEQLGRGSIWGHIFETIFWACKVGPAGRVPTVGTHPVGAVFGSFVGPAFWVPFSWPRGGSAHQAACRAPGLGAAGAHGSAVEGCGVLHGRF